MPPKPRFDLPLVPAIYMLTFRGRDVYCGSSRRIRDRIYNHFWRLERGKHKSPEIQEVYNSSPEEFGYRVVEYCREEELLTKERHWTALCNDLLSSMPLGQSYSEATLRRKSQIAKKQFEDPEQLRVARERARVNAAKQHERWLADTSVREERRENAHKGGAAIKAKLQDPDVMEKHRAGIRARWADPEYKARVSESIRRARAGRSSSVGS